MKLVEIGRMNRLFVDRELRLAELKQRVRELENGRIRQDDRQ